jgi:hypothetical protein
VCLPVIYGPATVVQIPAGRRSVLDAYGEIILRGWREAVGACLPEIESSLIQVRSHANTAVEFSLFRLLHARPSVLQRGWALEQRRRRQISRVPKRRPTHARQHTVENGPIRSV